MSYNIGECVICGRDMIGDTNHKCTPLAISRYEKRMRAIEQEPNESRDALREGLELLEQLSEE